MVPLVPFGKAVDINRDDRRHKPGGFDPGGFASDQAGELELLPF